MSSSSQPSRKSIFEEASKRLSQEFEQLKNIPHNGESGREAETILKRFLVSHLPKRYAVHSGFILDDADQVSPQSDVIIVDAFNCPVLETFKDNFIIPADNAAVVVEVKSKLRARDIEDAAEKIAAIKRLRKSRAAVPPGPHVIDTLGVLFAFDSDMSLQAINKHHRANITKHGASDSSHPIGTHIDYIFVLGKGMTTLMVHFPGENASFSPIVLYPESMPNQDMVLMTGFVKYGHKTLDAFLRFLLAHLTFYYPRVSHPGFDLSPADNQDPHGRGVTPLAVIRTDKDATKAKDMMRQFEDKMQPFLEGR